MPRLAALCGLVILLCLVNAPRAQAVIFELEGLRLGMTRNEASLVLPGLSIREVPYEDERIGFDYRITFGRIAILRYEAQIFRDSGDGVVEEFNLTFTGRDELFDIRMLRLDGRKDCAGHFDDVVARWGPPLIVEPGYAMWRTTVVLGPRLSFRCQDDQRGLFELRLDQEIMQRNFIDDLSRDLVPAIQEAIQFLLGR